MHETIIFLDLTYSALCLRKLSEHKIQTLLKLKTCCAQSLNPISVVTVKMEVTLAAPRGQVTHSLPIWPSSLNKCPKLSSPHVLKQTLSIPHRKKWQLLPQRYARAVYLTCPCESILEYPVVLFSQSPRPSYNCVDVFHAKII